VQVFFAGQPIANVYLFPVTIFISTSVAYAGQGNEKSIPQQIIKFCRDIMCAKCKSTPKAELGGYMINERTELLFLDGTECGND